MVLDANIEVKDKERGERFSLSPLPPQTATKKI